jgi:subtilisin family serine protease/flagellar hook assembly protein FlgD
MLAAVSALACLLTGAAAVADPLPGAHDQAQPRSIPRHTDIPRSTVSRATQLKHAFAATGTKVLIVHVDGGAAGLRDAISSAESPHVALRHTFARTQSFSVQVPASDERAAIARLRSEPDVTGVEKSVSRHFFTAPEAGAPDDTRFSRQQPYLDAVDAPTAWESQTGSPTVKIAVIDSGIDVDHPDLQNKVVAAYNAHNGGTNITDTVGHGTFVAGVAAADTDNALGVAGAGYDTSLLGVKIAGPDGSLSIDDEVAGIRWAVTHGANIINLSLGGTDYSSSERNAVEYAISKGVLVVAAAGNDGDRAKQYPAAYPGVIAVGATDPANGTRADFSSHGRWVTLAAPGVGIYSTTPRAGSQYFATTSGYGYADGTSFSAPLVSGEAALMKAQNPSLTVNQLRADLIASAGGYRHLGLGAGQVDFAQGLAHVAPTTAPTSAGADGTSDEIDLHATSTARAVEFRIDSDQPLKPVAVTNGSAELTWPSWGYANGTHTVSATNCTAYGECGSRSFATTFTVDNSAPDLLYPASGVTTTGRFTVTGTHPSGGALRLRVDGHTAGFSTTQPYTFLVNASMLRDGPHTLRVTLCSTDRTHCGGPSSANRDIVTQALHPKIVALSPSDISPNGDGVRDDGTLTFSLPDTESVAIETLNSTGGVVRTADLGRLPAGRHTWKWQGQQDDGTTLADGNYSVAVVTTKLAGASLERGWADHPVRVDTHAPTLTSATGGGVRFYPVKDGYRDLFTPTVEVGSAGRLSLTISDRRGTVVRTISEKAPGGTTQLSWNGRNRGGHVVAAGTYHWRFTVTDAAGNTRRTANRNVAVSHKRLVTRKVDIVRHGAGFDYAGGTDPSCTSARTRTSTFHRGVQLLNGCRPSNGDLAYAAYTFALPKSHQYRRIAIQVLGHSTHRPSELSASLQRSDGGLEIPRYVRITKPGNHWTTIVSAPATGHVTKSGHVLASVLLDSAYAGTNQYDEAYVRLRVTYVGLT